MRTHSFTKRPKIEPADRLTASIQPRSWGDSPQPAAQVDQPQSFHGFSHVNLFAHDPGPRSVPNIIQAKLAEEQHNLNKTHQLKPLESGLQKAGAQPVEVSDHNVQRQPHGTIHHSHENSHTTIQRGRTLKDEDWKLPDKKHSKKYYRIINKAKTRYEYKNSSKRNLFVLRVASKDGAQRLNILLRSAGMGGIHPRGIGGRTAGHTEPQAAAILTNPHMRKRILHKLGKGWKVQSIFSSNQPCSSKGGGTHKGCCAMETETLGNPTNFHTGTGEEFKGGKGMTQGQTLKALEEDDELSDGSEDEFYDEDEVRGKDLTGDDLDPTKL